MNGYPFRQMIKLSDGDIFEQMRSMEQALTFEEAAWAFARYKVDFSEDKYIALGMRGLQDDQYTDLARQMSEAGSIEITGRGMKKRYRLR